MKSKQRQIHDNRWISMITHPPSSSVSLIGYITLVCFVQIWQGSCLSKQQGANILTQYKAATKRFQSFVCLCNKVVNIKYSMISL